MTFSDRVIVKFTIERSVMFLVNITLHFFLSIRGNVPQLAENKSPHLTDVEDLYLLYPIATVREVVFDRIMPSQNQYTIGE